MDINLSLIVEHARRDEMFKTRSSATQSANRESQRSRASTTSNSGGAPQGTTPRGSGLTLPGATDPCNYPGRC